MRLLLLLASALAVVGCASGGKDVRVAEVSSRTAEPARPLDIPPAAPSSDAAARPEQAVAAPVCGGEIDIVNDADDVISKKFDCFLKDSKLTNSPARTLVQILDDKIRFDFGSALLKPEHKALLARLARVTKGPGLEKYCITVYGHTDAAGTDFANAVLSRARAKSVADILGGGSLKVNYKGLGASLPKNKANPFAPENRRVRAVNKCD